MYSKRIIHCRQSDTNTIILSEIAVVSLITSNYIMSAMNVMQQPYRGITVFAYLF